MRISDWSSDVCSSDLAAATVAAAQEHLALALAGEVEQHVLLVLAQDLRAHRHLDDEIVAARACAVRSRATFAAGGTEMLGVAEIDQRVEAVDGLEDDVAAFAAVAAVGPAIFDELFMAKAHRTGAAGARAHENLGGIEEMPNTKSVG